MDASLLMPAIVYYLLQRAILRKHGAGSILAKALGGDIKGKISPFLYLAVIALVLVSPRPSIAIYVLVALMWLVPDRRIENALRESELHRRLSRSSLTGEPHEKRGSATAVTLSPRSDISP